MKPMPMMLTLLLAACATPRPPEELIAARTRYEEARNGETARLNPSGLIEAQKAIDVASRAFDERGPDLRTRDLSYVALRKVQVAELDGQVASAQQSASDALHANGRAGATARPQIHAIDQAEQAARSEPSSEGESTPMADEQRRETYRQAKQYEAERQAQQDALEQVAQVSRDERGTVVTLSGSLLFVSGEAALTSQGRERLNDVAKAMLQARSAGFAIEGYTDSIGTSTANDALSMRRADSVRDYLISRGIPPDDVRAVGMGERKPVADNSTADGRAANRRLEIVISPPTGVAAQ